MIKLTVKTVETNSETDKIGIKETLKNETFGEYMTLFHHVATELLKKYDTTKEELKEIIDKVGK